MNQVSFYLARREFFLPFKTILKKRTPGGRDFFWLTVLVTLIFSCALLLFSIKQGLSDRFVDVLLGSVPNAGIPIWVQTNPYHGSKQELDEGLLAQIAAHAQAQAMPQQVHAAKPLTIHPYGDVSVNFIDLPDKAEVWADQSEGFKGLAIYPEDPLWRYAMGDNTGQTAPRPLLHLVLSRSLVEKHFNYPLYLENLKKTLPTPLWAKLPKTKEAFLASKNPDIWMEFGIPSESFRELLPVKVTWVERLPIPGNHTFLVSAHLYHAMQFAFFNSHLHYFPETALSNNTLLAKLRVSGLVFNGETTEEVRKNFAACLGIGELSQSTGLHYLKLRHSVPTFWLDACRDQFQLGDSVSEESVVAGDLIFETRGPANIRCSEWPGELFSPEERKSCQENSQAMVLREVPVISASCSHFPSHELSVEEKSDCDKDPGLRIERRMTEQVEQFQYAFLYVPKRDQLDQAMQFIDNLPDKPLYLTATYDDSLKRFSALTEILVVLGEWFAGLTGVFLVVLLYVQLTTLVGHRRHTYGILLAKGIAYGELYAIIAMQLLFVIAIGFSLAAMFIKLIRHLLERNLWQVADRFKSVLTLPESSLLPLEPSDYAVVLGVGGVVILGVALFILRKLPLKHSTAPEELFDVA